MKTGNFFNTPKQYFLLLALSLGVSTSSPTLALAGSLETGAGILGGALVGSLLGPEKQQGRNALIGALAGGVLTQMVTSSAAEPLRAGRFAEPAPRTVTYPEPTTTVYTEPAATVYTKPKMKVYTKRGETRCRPMETEGIVNGQMETLVGTACRTGRGPWKFQGTLRPVQQTVVYQQEPQTVIIEHQPRRIVTYQTPQPVIVEHVYQPVIVYPSSSAVFYSSRERHRYKYRSRHWRRHHDRSW